MSARSLSGASGPRVGRSADWPSSWAFRRDGAGLRRRLDPVFASDARDPATRSSAEIRAATRVRGRSAFLVPLLDASDGERTRFSFARSPRRARSRRRLRAGPPLSGGELLTVLEGLLAGPRRARGASDSRTAIRLHPTSSSRRPAASRLARRDVLDAARSRRDSRPRTRTPPAATVSARCSGSSVSPPRRSAYDPLAAELLRALSTAAFPRSGSLRGPAPRGEAFVERSVPSHVRRHLPHPARFPSPDAGRGRRFDRPALRPSRRLSDGPRRLRRHAGAARERAARARTSSTKSVRNPVARSGARTRRSVRSASRPRIAVRAAAALRPPVR